MTNASDFNKVVTDFLNSLPVEPKAFEDGTKTVAAFGERLSAVALEFASKSNEITSRSVGESIANLRGLTVVRKEPADYGKAIADFVQGQFDLAVRSAEEFGAVAQSAGQTTVDLVTEAGEQAKDQVSANVNAATKKVKQPAKKAA